jgi:FKBP-type peptidyl-prolyl cis-trans isomerase FkpA
MALLSVRPLRRPALLFVGLAAGSLLAGCTLSGTTELPPLTDPATISYNASTGVTSIAAMTRINESLYTQDVTVGTGRVVQANDSISVYYRGQLSTGFAFDSTQRPAAPTRFVLAAPLITGWTVGLPGMRVGGVRRLVIGPASAYGYNTITSQATGAVLIPSNSVLVFLVEVVDAQSRS